MNRDARQGSRRGRYALEESELIERRGAAARDRRAIEGRECRGGCSTERSQNPTPDERRDLAATPRRWSKLCRESATLDGVERSVKRWRLRRELASRRRAEALTRGRARVGWRVRRRSPIHVLETCPTVAALEEAARVARYVLVEVPLQDDRAACRPAKRKPSEGAGHLQAMRTDAGRAAARHGRRAANWRPSSPTRSPTSITRSSPGARREPVKWALRAGACRLGAAERWSTTDYAVLATRV